MELIEALLDLARLRARAYVLIDGGQLAQTGHSRILIDIAPALDHRQTFTSVFDLAHQLQNLLIVLLRPRKPHRVAFSFYLILVANRPLEVVHAIGASVVGQDCLSEIAFYHVCASRAHGLRELGLFIVIFGQLRHIALNFVVTGLRGKLIVDLPDCGLYPLVLLMSLK